MHLQSNYQEVQELKLAAFLIHEKSLCKTEYVLHLIRFQVAFVFAQKLKNFEALA